MRPKVTEIARGTYRISTFNPDFGIQFNQNLIADDKPFLMHTGATFARLAERARREGCRHLELDSGVQRFDAHRFYLAHRMFISSHHFRLGL